MDLSVVIASIDSAQSIASCLSHLRRACEGLRAEIIVVDASTDGTAGRLKDTHESPVVIQAPVGTLAPELWAEGYRQSRGRIVAFTTGHCLVSPGWATALIAALEHGADGAGGPLILGKYTRPLDWAIYYLRYSGAMPHTLGAGRIRGEIAGDNAAYTRRSLDHHAATFTHGFWEVDFHRLIRADGGWIAAVPKATVDFSRSFQIGTILRHRFAHGRHFGAGRVSGGDRRAWQIVAAAPVVPALLAARAATRAVGGPSFWRFVAALPWFFVLAGDWAGGEAWGAWRTRATAPPRQRPS